MRADQITINRAYLACSYEGGPTVPVYLWRALLSLGGGQEGDVTFVSSSPADSTADQIR